MCVGIYQLERILVFGMGCLFTEAWFCAVQKNSCPSLPISFAIQVYHEYTMGKVHIMKGTIPGPYFLLSWRRGRCHDNFGTCVVHGRPIIKPTQQTPMTAPKRVHLLRLTFGKRSTTPVIMVSTCTI